MLVQSIHPQTYYEAYCKFSLYLTPFSFVIYVYIWMEVFCWEIDSFVRDSMIGPPNMTNLTLNDLHEMTDVSNNAP